MMRNLRRGIVATVIFALTIILSKGNSNWIMAALAFIFVYCIIDVELVRAKERREHLRHFEYRPAVLSKPQAWEEEIQRKWFAPPLSERLKRDLIDIGFHGYSCGICGFAYFTLKGVSNCCRAAKAAGAKENPILSMYGRSSISPHMRPTTTVTGIGYPGQFEHLSGYHRPR